MRKLYHFLFFTIFVIIFNGCSSDYYINNQYIKSNIAFDFMVRIDKIDVKTFDKNGIPKDFDVDTSVLVDPNITDSNFFPLKKLYFKKHNPGYTWIIWRPISPVEYNVSPLTFSTKNWYNISNLAKDDNYDYEMFIYVDEKGKFEIYDRYRPGPW